jgi:hypothetical protein
MVLGRGIEDRENTRSVLLPLGRTFLTRQATLFDLGQLFFELTKAFCG